MASVETLEKHPARSLQALLTAAAGILVTLFALWNLFVAPIEARVHHLEGEAKTTTERTAQALQRIEDKLDEVSQMVERLDERTNKY